MVAFILNRHLLVRITEVRVENSIHERAGDGRMDSGLGEAMTDQPEPQPSLTGGVDVSAHQLESLLSAVSAINAIAGSALSSQRGERGEGACVPPTDGCVSERGEFLDRQGRVRGTAVARR